MKKLYKHILWSIGTIGLVLFSMLCWTVWSFAQRGRQVRTFADMKVISQALKRAADGGFLDQEEGLRVVRQYHQGKDAWGSDFVFISMQDRGHLLISKGRDRKLDVESLETYFFLERQKTAGDFSRDIVFRNYEPVTLAGK